MNHYRRQIITTVLAGAAALFSGCASTVVASKTSLPPGSAKIVVYRESGFAAMFAGPSVFIDGVEQGKLYPGYYFQSSVKSGLHKLRFEGSFMNFPGPARTIEIQIGEGETSYTELEILDGGGPAVVARAYHTRSEEYAKPVVARLKRAQ